jgi:hypothetical protein
LPPTGSVPAVGGEAGVSGEFLHVAQTAAALNDLPGGLSDEPPRPMGKDFATERMAAATIELRDMTVDAWRSADAAVGYPHVKMRDVEAGKVMQIAELKGRD